ncbi:GIY-YIG nuclease family protein [Rhodococcus sp. CSLK01-03]|uniref:GIY-YIG nuclease family protein n=1 Tax=Rhodococcus indonesiensis TaxID=3055869 RepID=A0ABT7RMG7_9NOCA|nr:GIY-YIG nuclease family protein [Rhodococcus indonesiensis]MDM7488822.1 GIY-YIG nuclease family protein [Rhodococcus indonesiensis]
MSTGGARHRGNTLHQAFPDRRVNKVNPRREFFYATPEEVLDVLRQHVGEVLSYTAEPEAEEYRISIGQKRRLVLTPGTAPGPAECRGPCLGSPASG